MQTILGSGGAISRELLPELVKYTDRIRLAARNPGTYSGKEELFKVDLLDADRTAMAVEGSDVVYLLAGLQYDIRVWKVSWPRIMDNVIGDLVQCLRNARQGCRTLSLAIIRKTGQRIHQPTMLFLHGLARDHTKDSR